MKKIILVIALSIPTITIACPLCGVVTWLTTHEVGVVAVGAGAAAISQVESMTINGIVLKNNLMQTKPIAVKAASGISAN